MSYEQYFKDLLADNYKEDIDIILYREKKSVTEKINKTKSDISDIDTYIQMLKLGQKSNLGQNVSINDLYEDRKELEIKLAKLSSDLNNIQNKINYWNENKNNFNGY